MTRYRAWVLTEAGGVWVLSFDTCVEGRVQRFKRDQNRAGNDVLIEKYTMVEG